MARSLARAIDYPDPEEAYFAGLLHNLGRWIWLAQFPEQYAAVIGNPLCQDTCRLPELG